MPRKTVDIQLLKTSSTKLNNIKGSCRNVTEINCSGSLLPKFCY